MSTLATADLGSDDENDGDFVPATKPKTGKGKGKRVRGGGGSDSDSDSSDGEGEEGEGEGDAAAALRAEAAEAEAAARRARAAAAFAEMQAEAKKPRAAAETKVEEDEWVEVQRPRRFAGETIMETVKLRKSDPEAIKWLATKGGGAGDASGEGDGTTQSSSADAAGSAEPAPKPRPRGPVRKRPRQSLEALAAAIDSGKKMTTLEKSQMDWNSHLTTQRGVADELAAHRRSGGYLEKQAFLDRVGERRSAGQDAAKPTRRR